MARARTRSHHQGPLHEPPGRRREHRGAPRVARRGGVDRRHARGRGGAPQPGPGGRRRVQGPRARGSARVRHDRRRRPAHGDVGSRRGAVRAQTSSTPPITCGHAFGGDFEAVSVYSALAVARHVAHADAAVVAMGPGIVGTNTRLGFSGMEVGTILDAAAALGGVPIACLRVSFADERPRHYGLSHHTATALRLATREPRAGGGPRAPRRRAGRTPGADLARRGHRPPPRAGDGRRARRARAARPPRSAGRSRWGARPRTIPRCSRPPPPPVRSAAPHRWLTGSMADRLERLLNLTATLLDTRRPLTLDELAERVEPRYPEDKAARRRQFERDKETLRELGVPITVEIGRRHRRRPGVPHRPEDYYLPSSRSPRPSSPRSTSRSPRCGSKGDDGREGARQARRPVGEGVAEAVRRGRGDAGLAALFEAVSRHAPVDVLVPRRARGGSSRTASCCAGVTGTSSATTSTATRRGRSGSTASTANPRWAKAGSFEPPPGIDPAKFVRDDPLTYGEDQPVEARVLVDAPRAAGWSSSSAKRRSSNGAPTARSWWRSPVVNRAAFRSWVLDLLDHAEVLGPAGAARRHGRVARRARSCDADAVSPRPLVGPRLRARARARAVRARAPRRDHHRARRAVRSLEARARTRSRAAADVRAAAVHRRPPDRRVDRRRRRSTIRLAEYFERPLRLTPAEGLALLAAGRALLAVPGSDADGPLATALDKLDDALGAERTARGRRRRAATISKRLQDAASAPRAGRDRLLLVRARRDDDAHRRSVAGLPRVRRVVPRGLVPPRRTASACSASIASARCARPASTSIPAAERDDDAVRRARVPPAARRPPGHAPASRRRPTGWWRAIPHEVGRASGRTARGGSCSRSASRRGSSGSSSRSGPTSPWRRRRSSSPGRGRRRRRSCAATDERTRTRVRLRCRTLRGWGSGAAPVTDEVVETSREPPLSAPPRSGNGSGSTARRRPVTADERADGRRRVRSGTEPHRRSSGASSSSPRSSSRSSSRRSCSRRSTSRRSRWCRRSRSATVCSSTS